MIAALAAYMATTTVAIGVMFAQTDIVDPLIEIGGTVGVAGGAVLIVRWVMKATAEHTERLSSENDRLRARVSELEGRLDSKAD